MSVITIKLEMAELSLKANRIEEAEKTITAPRMLSASVDHINILYELEGLAKNFCVVSLTGNHLFHCLSKAISAVGVVRK